MATERMPCPHCGDGVGIDFDETYFAVGAGHRGRVRAADCPLCERPVVLLDVMATALPPPVAVLTRRPVVATGRPRTPASLIDVMVYPRTGGRAPAPDEVPPRIAKDYHEAALVASSSPTAAGALARRCLQAVLTDAGATSQNLGKQIDLVLPTLPTHLAEAIDAVRWVGNFAAHQIKETHTDEMVEVEDGEVAWLLDTLEGLFDFYYVAPARTARRRAQLNEKLSLADRPRLKGSDDQ